MDRTKAPDLKRREPPTWLLILSFWAASSIGLGAFFLCAFAGMGEPYGNLDVLLQSSLESMPRMLAFTTVPATAVTCVIAAAILDPRWAAAGRSVVLSSVLLLPLWLAWCVAFFCSQTHSPGYDIHERPDWLQWGGWDWLGHPVWPLLGAAYLVFVAWRAAGRGKRNLGQEPPGAFPHSDGAA